MIWVLRSYKMTVLTVNGGRSSFIMNEVDNVERIILFSYREGSAIACGLSIKTLYRSLVYGGDVIIWPMWQCLGFLQLLFHEFLFFNIFCCIKSHLGCWTPCFQYFHKTLLSLDGKISFNYFLMYNMESRKLLKIVPWIGLVNMSHNMSFVVQYLIVYSSAAII